MRLGMGHRGKTDERPCCDCGQVGKQNKVKEFGRVLYFCDSCHAQYQDSCDEATDIPDDYGDYLHDQSVDRKLDETL